MYLDTATREGMSGSPVIQYRRRAVSFIGNHGQTDFHAQFVGIYSGRIIPRDFFEAQLGKVWKADCIDEIIDGGCLYDEFA